MAAKDYVDNARRVADRASGISVVLFAGLLVSVLSDFGPKLATFRAAAVAERTQSNHEPSRTIDASLGYDRLKVLRDVVDNLEKKQQEIESKLESVSRNDRGTLAGELLEVQSKLENAKENLDQAERAYAKASETAAAISVLRDAQRRATEDVKLKGFGFELGVRGSWASVVWLFIFLLGILNLCFARVGFAAELRAGARDDENIFESLRVPLWLHPISASPLASAGAVVFSDTLTLAVVLLAMGCGAAAFWMARLTLAAPILLAPGHEMQGRLGGIVVGCLIAAILVTLSSWAIPVRLTDRAGKGGGNALRRRLLLIFPILAVTCSAAAAPAPLRRLIQQTLLSPRRRRRVRGAALEPGFYMHKKTCKIHYVPLEGYAKSLRGADIANFTKIDPATLNAAHRPLVHVKALVPYSRQMVRNLGGDHDAIAKLMWDIFDTRGSSLLMPVPATGLTVEPVEVTKPLPESNRSRTRRKRGNSARSHGQWRSKSRHHQDKANAERRRDGINPPVQLIQIADLLARLAARTRNSHYLDRALAEVRAPIFAMKRQDRNGDITKHAERIRDGVVSRLIPRKGFSPRRFESALRQLEESSERRKYESELLQIMKAHPQALDDVARLERRASRRERVWSSQFWMSDYNLRKVRLIRRRGKRKKVKFLRA